MDKSMIKGMAVGGIAMVVLGSGAVTGYKAITKPQFAEVVDSDSAEPAFKARTEITRSPASKPK